MKSAMRVLSILVLGFIAGCQDNPMTNPISRNQDVSSEYSGTDGRPTKTFFIRALLHEPFGLNEVTEVTGVVSYIVYVLQRDPIPPAAQSEVRVTLNVEAILNPEGIANANWRVAGSTVDALEVSDETDVSAAVIVRRYPITGRTDGVVLQLEFGVVGELVHLASIRLVPPKIRPADDHQ